MQRATAQVDGVPDLSWVPVEGQATADQVRGALTLQSAGGVDWTNDATGGAQQHAAASLAFVAPAGPFVLSARVSVVGRRTTFDAGALSIWSDHDHWAKVCFEFSPQGEAMVVSVVTHGYSDDVNSVLVAESSVYLRIAALGDHAWAFHSSTDGLRWNFVRLFNLRGSDQAPTMVGFLSQAPFGEGCDATFDKIVYREELLSDLRDGS